MIHKVFLCELNKKKQESDDMLVSGAGEKSFFFIVCLHYMCLSHTKKIKKMHEYRKNEFT